MAAGDGRLGIILVVLLPVIGWVLFNILGPAKNQLDNMTGSGGGRRRGIAGMWDDDHVAIYCSTSVLC